MNLVIFGSEFYSLYFSWLLSTNNKLIILNKSNFNGLFVNENYGGIFIHKNEKIIKMLNDLGVDYKFRQLIEVGFSNSEIVKLHTIQELKKDDYLKKIMNCNIKNIKIDTTSFFNDIKEIIIFDKYEFIGKLICFLLKNNVIFDNSKSFCIKDGIIKAESGNEYKYDKLLFTSSLIDYNQLKNNYLDDYIVKIGDNIYAQNIIFDHDMKEITWDVCYFYDKFCPNISNIKRIVKKNQKIFTVEYFKYFENHSNSLHYLTNCVNKIFNNYTYYIDLPFQLPGSISVNDFYEIMIPEIDDDNIYLFGRYCTLRTREYIGDTIEDFHSRFLKRMDNEY